MKATDVDKTHESLLRAIEYFYDVAGCSLVRVLKHRPHSFCAKIVTGSHRELFLKEQTCYLANDEFEFHLRLQRYICEQKGPVVRGLTTVDNKLWFPWNGRKFEVHEWFEGERFTFRN